MAYAVTQLIVALSCCIVTLVGVSWHTRDAAYFVTSLLHSFLVYPLYSFVCRCLHHLLLISAWHGDLCPNVMVCWQTYKIQKYIKSFPSQCSTLMSCLSLNKSTFGRQCLLGETTKTSSCVHAHSEALYTYTHTHTHTDFDKEHSRWSYIALQARAGAQHSPKNHRCMCQGRDCGSAQDCWAPHAAVQQQP